MHQRPTRSHRIPDRAAAAGQAVKKVKKKAKAKTGSKPRKAVAYKVNPALRLGAAAADLLLASMLPLVFLIWGWWWLAALVIAATMLVRDGLPLDALEYQSPGKRMVGLHVEDKDGTERIDIETSIKRNLPLVAGLVMVPVVGMVDLRLALVVAAIPPIVELVLIFGDNDGRRFGDKLADTKVLD